MDGKIVSGNMEKLANKLEKAREASGKSIKEICDILGIPASRLKNYEKGKYLPTLPELEALSYLYRIPLSALIEKDEIDGFIHEPDAALLQKLLEIRNAFISTHLQLAREEKEISFKELSEKTGLTTGRIKKYETGASQPQIDELKKLTEALEISYDEMKDLESPIGKWQKMQALFDAVRNMPEELLDFISNSENYSSMKAAKQIAKIGVNNLSTLNASLSNLLSNIEE